jgi:hypothetical protein
MLIFASHLGFHSILGQSKTKGQKLVDDLLAKRQELKTAQTQIGNLEERLNRGEESTISYLLIQSELEQLFKSIERLAEHIKMGENKLGIPADAPTGTVLDVQFKPFFVAKMNARALKHRIRTRIVEYKFEHRKLERSYQAHVNRTLSFCDSSGPDLNHVLRGFRKQGARASESRHSAPQ